MNEENGRRRHFYRASKRRRRIFGIAVIALLLTTLLALRPAYRWLKAKRADSLAANAEQFVQQKNLLEAANTYRAALQLDPLGYRPLQGAARLATRLNHVEALRGSPYVTSPTRFPAIASEKWDSARRRHP